MITIENDQGVSVGDVVQKVFQAMQVPVTHSEWWIASAKQRSRIAETWESNLEASSGPAFDKQSGGEARKSSDCIRRVDWLQGKVYWQGLVQDESFLTERGLGGQRNWEGAWVLNLKY